jgi:hypothetical protein
VFCVDSEAEAETMHLICSGGEMRAVDDDASDEWNGAKKVMNSSEPERLLSDNNAWDATVCANTLLTLTGAAEGPYATRTRAILR